MRNWRRYGTLVGSALAIAGVLGSVFVSRYFAALMLAGFALILLCSPLWTGLRKPKK